jgi:Zn-dependent protease/CBS domain-containing protein
MGTWSIPAGQIFGVNLRIHFSFILLLLYLWTLDPQTTANGGARGLAMVGLLFVSVVLHELGHLWMSARSGTKVRAVVLFPIGGLAVNDPGTAFMQRNTPANVAKDVRIALAGPLASLIVAGLSAVVIANTLPQAHVLQHPYVSAANLPRTFVWMNLFLAGFNLLPAYPLDGGRIVRSMFARTVDFVTATRRAVTVGHGFAILFIFAGMVWNNWLMLAGLLLFIAAQLEERSVLFQSALESMRMEEVMLTDFATLSPADTLEDALSKAVHTLQDDFPVIRGTDMVGVVTKQKIMDALRGDGNAYVQSIMDRAYETTNKNESLATAFSKFTQRGMTILPVVDDERLVGIVTLQNLMHSIGVLAESKKMKRDSDDRGSEF